MKIKIAVAVIVVQILLLLFWFWPYSDNFTATYDHVTDEVVRLIEENPTVEGVDKATRYYNARQSSLKDLRDWGLKPDKNGAISETVRSAYMNSLSRTNRKLDKLEEKYPNIKAGSNL